MFLYGSPDALVSMDTVNILGNAASDLGSAVCVVEGNATLDLSHVVMKNNTVTSVTNNL
jgi:hypothetical protein